VVNRSNDITKKEMDITDALRAEYGQTRDPTRLLESYGKFAASHQSVEQDMAQLYRDVKSLKLTDEGLAALKARILKNYGYGNQAMHNLTTNLAILSKLPGDDPAVVKQFNIASTNVDQAMATLGGANNQEIALVTELRNYCAVKN
jgi:hypothetical protein